MQFFSAGNGGKILKLRNIKEACQLILILKEQGVDIEMNSCMDP